MNFRSLNPTAVTIRNFETSISSSADEETREDKAQGAVLVGEEEGEYDEPG